MIFVEIFLQIYKLHDASVNEIKRHPYSDTALTVYVISGCIFAVTFILMVWLYFYHKMIKPVPPQKVIESDEGMEELYVKTRSPLLDREDNHRKIRPHSSRNSYNTKYAGLDTKRKHKPSLRKVDVPVVSPSDEIPIATEVQQGVDNNQIIVFNRNNIETEIESSDSQLTHPRRPMTWSHGVSVGDLTLSRHRDMVDRTSMNYDMLPTTNIPVVVNSMRMMHHPNQMVYLDNGMFGYHQLVPTYEGELSPLEMHGDLCSFGNPRISLIDERTNYAGVDGYEVDCAPPPPYIRTCKPEGLLYPRSTSIPLQEYYRTESYLDDFYRVVPNTSFRRTLYDKNV